MTQVILVQATEIAAENSAKSACADSSESAKADFVAQRAFQPRLQPPGAKVANPTLEK